MMLEVLCKQFFVLAAWGWLELITELVAAACLRQQHEVPVFTASQSKKQVAHRHDCTPGSCVHQLKPGACLCAGIMSPSPIQEYTEALEDFPNANRAAAQAGIASLLNNMDIDTDELSVEGTAFYAVQSCINHSCQPNAHALRSGGDPNSFAVIVATQDIPDGDEVTISYIDESLPYEQRQEALQDYGFVCCCPVCQQHQSFQAQAEQG